MARTLTNIILATSVCAGGSASAKEYADYSRYETSDLIDIEGDIEGELVRFQQGQDSSVIEKEPTSMLTVQMRDEYVLFYNDSSGNDLALESVAIVKLRPEICVFTYNRAIPEEKIYVESAQRQFEVYLQKILLAKEPERQRYEEEKRKAGERFLQNMTAPQEK